MQDCECKIVHARLWMQPFGCEICDSRLWMIKNFLFKIVVEQKFVNQDSG